MAIKKESVIEILNYQKKLALDLNDEICVDCINAIIYKVNELAAENPWHTGTPTEEGWYLIQDSDGAGTFFETEYFDTERIAKWSDDNKFDGLAWQKIEPLGFPVLDMEGEIG